MSATAPVPRNEPVTGAARYEAVVATDISFTSGVVSDAIVSTTSYQVPCSALGYNALYYWRVAATSVLGQGAFTPYQTFTTGGATGSVPGAPTNLTSTSVFDGSIYHPRLSWSAPAGTVTGY